MEPILHRSHSNHLHRTMNVYEYGCGGPAVLIIPTEGGRFFDFENFGMCAACEELLNAGCVRFFCCDTIDREALAWWDGPLPQRMAAELQWSQYITRELYPFIRRRLTIGSAPEETAKLYIAGCGMGGYQAAELFFGNPELFDGLLSLSGFYNLCERLGGCISDDIIRHSPWHQVYNMPKEKLRGIFPPFGNIGYRNLILGCGSGDWEDSCLSSLSDFEKLLNWKQIPAEILYFGPQAAHDWNSWREQFPFCLRKLLAK